MELRKVQLTGGSSITVTLPKSWVEKTSIKPGDVVGFLEQSDGSLTLQSHVKGDRKTEEYVIEVEEADTAFLFRQIIAAYLMGYDVIRLVSKRPLIAASRQTIRQAVRRIVGLEIIDEQPSSISLQDFLNPQEFHIEKAVRRMGILTQSMQEEAMTALREPRPEVTQSEQDRDAEVDRLYWLVNKQYHTILRDSNLAAKMGLNAGQALNFLLVARVLERTADHADRIANEALLLASAVASAKIPTAFVERLERQFRRAVELFQGALQTFIRKDAKRATAIIDEVDKLLETQRRLIREASEMGGEAVAHGAYIIESIMRTAAYAADLGEVAINHQVASQRVTHDEPSQLRHGKHPTEGLMVGVGSRTRGAS